MTLFCQCVHTTAATTVGSLTLTSRTELQGSKEDLCLGRFDTYFPSSVSRTDCFPILNSVCTVEGETLDSASNQLLPDTTPSTGEPVLRHEDRKYWGSLCPMNRQTLSVHWRKKGRDGEWILPVKVRARALLG